MSDALRAISFAVRFKVVLKYLCQLLFIIAVLNTVPLALSLYYGEFDLSLRYLLFIGGLLCASLPYRWLPAPTQLQNNEAMTIIAFAFLLSPLLATYTMSQTGLPFIDLLFEAVSAITTTGLSTVQNPQNYTMTFQFSRSWMQWYGGLGIVVLSLAFLMGHQSVARKFAESLSGENLLTTAQTYARRIFLIYVILTLVAFSLIWLSTFDGFISLLHALSAVSTGGFSNLSGSLGDIPSWSARLLITLACFAGALPFAIYIQFFHRQFRPVLTSFEVIVFIILCCCICTYLAINIYHTLHFSWQEAILHGLAIGISAQSSAGFTTLDLSQFDPFSKLMMIFSMFIGGNVGSTAGGMKVLHLVIFLRLMQIGFQRSTLPPHAILENSFEKRVLNESDITKVFLLILAFITTTVFSWAIFLLYGYDAMDALFEVVSATMTVGLSVGITRPELETPLKLLLCLDMWLGRVEIFTLLILLYPRNWFGRKR